MFILSFEVGETMIRLLDGIALLAYTRRLKLSKETHELLTHIRSSPPSRTPGARRGNMPVWYPSKKMHCIIKAESTKVEFPFLLAAEHDDDVLEIWDQPRPFHWNISINVAISNGQCIPPTTLSSVLANVDRSSVNRLKNCSSKL